MHLNISAYHNFYNNDFNYNATPLDSFSSPVIIFDIPDQQNL